MALNMASAPAEPRAAWQEEKEDRAKANHLAGYPLEKTS